MGITSAFFAATSGINATSRALSEIGNNIANAQTIGYKSRSVSFGDLFGATIGGGGTSTALVEGRGVRVLGIDPSFTQGSLQTTSNALDLAIDGDGFFRVSDATGNIFYSRAGQFDIDSQGNLVNPAGLRLQGDQADDTGLLTGSIGNLTLTTTTQPGVQTLDVAMSGRLAADAPVNNYTTAQVLDPITNKGLFPGNTSVRVFDSVGVGHDLQIYFAQTAENVWEYSVLAQGDEVETDPLVLPPANYNATTNNVLVADGTLTYTSDGFLSLESGTTYYSGAGNGIDFLGATAQQPIAFDFGTSITEGGAGTDGLLQQGSSLNQNALVLDTLSQDGYGPGSLAGTSIGEDGVITGRFDNGTTRTLGQVRLTRFINPDGLQPIGRNLFIQSGDSGTPLDGVPGTGAFGKVSASTLEASNVDLGEELVNMITMQRGFQANSRIITTTNDLLGELVNLAR
ncbi:flagellar hook protein FlgE [Nitrospira sp. T9]|uniref:flagellar hook protein FlgE n=1 Tax=unclassified Nitrospira TaxID=2652172 RepID=UPI003F9A8429